MRHVHSYLLAGAALLGSVLLTVGCASGDDDADAIRDRQTAGGRFLDAASYADVLTISPSFPFGVTRKHAATGAVLGARWGNHGGPVVTTQDFSAPANPPKVTRWTLPDAATEAATSAELTSTLAPDLPQQRFWTADGFVDLPFGSLSMISYSGMADHNPGELIFYSSSYDRVVSRAHVNGFYGGVGLVDGDARRVVYSGLSSLASSPSTTKDNGLYGADICGESVAPSGSCGAATKLFGWQGNSGPVTADANGNVFVAAFVTGAPHTDAIYGITKAQAFSSSPETPATLVERDTAGTASLAAVSKPGSDEGWLVAKAYDIEAAAPAYARAYHSTGTALVADGPVVENAIAGTSPDASLSMFADPEGHLWVAVEAPDASWLFELEPTP